VVRAFALSSVDQIQIICRKHNYINYSKNHIHFLIHTDLVQFTTGGCEGRGLRVKQPPIVYIRLVKSTILCFAENCTIH